MKPMDIQIIVFKYDPNNYKYVIDQNIISVVLRKEGSGKTHVGLV